MNQVKFDPIKSRVDRYLSAKYLNNNKRLRNHVDFLQGTTSFSGEKILNLLLVQELTPKEVVDLDNELSLGGEQDVR